MPSLYRLVLPPQLLERGFWIYVCKIDRGIFPPCFYVGMTGDRSSFVAQSPFNRIAAHLEERLKSKSNHIRQHLRGREIEINSANAIDVAAYGPIGIVPSQKDVYQVARGKVEAVEKALWLRMKECGLDLLNKSPTCRSVAEPTLVDDVLRAFDSFLEVK
jgi:hypothetical protein